MIRPPPGPGEQYRPGRLIFTSPIFEQITGFATMKMLVKLYSPLPNLATYTNSFITEGQGIVLIEIWHTTRQTEETKLHNGKWRPSNPELRRPMCRAAAYGVGSSDMLVHWKCYLLWFLLNPKPQNNGQILLLGFFKMNPNLSNLFTIEWFRGFNEFCFIDYCVNESALVTLICSPFELGQKDNGKKHF